MLRAIQVPKSIVNKKIEELCKTNKVAELVFEGKGRNFDKLRPLSKRMLCERIGLRYDMDHNKVYYIKYSLTMFL